MGKGYLVWLLALSLCEIAFAHDTAYVKIDILGWTVRVNEAFAAKDSLTCYKAISVLVRQLKNIDDVLPAEALQEVKKIPIWLDEHTANPRAMQYHVSREWLKKHGYNPDKAQSVEISNADEFIEWINDQPWMVLHELAHGYHNRVLKDTNGLILYAFHHADSLKLYRHPRRFSKGKVYDAPDRIAYALTNEGEYFAELTEAYFGLNDWYPFNREQLKEYDPVGYRMIESVWGVR